MPLKHEFSKVKAAHEWGFNAYTDFDTDLMTIRYQVHPTTMGEKYIKKEGLFLHGDEYPLIPGDLQYPTRRHFREE
jgi:hypothetical protein